MQSSSEKLSAKLWLYFENKKVSPSHSEEKIGNLSRFLHCLIYSHASEGNVSVVALTCHVQDGYEKGREKAEDLLKRMPGLMPWL